MLRKILLAILFILISIGAYIYFTTAPMLPVGTGYAAKKMCSCYFIAGRSQESIQKDDLAPSPLNLTRNVINETEKSVASTLFGLGLKTAVYRENLGCILLDGEDDYNIQLNLPSPPEPKDTIWPIGSYLPEDKMEGVNYKSLQEAVNSVFDSSLNMESLRTRAVVVVYKDTLIAEQYANGFDANTPILGWSMNKSIINALIGILVKDGKLDLNQKKLFEHWTDERARITLNDMLQMQSGLAFEENYFGVSDATEMLFMSDNAVSRANQNPLDTTPGTKWYYSSGTTNMLSGIIRQQFQNHEDYLRFPHERLFRKIGMNSMVLETDEAGNYIGSSFGYATPRDWAKFGLLYLNEGNWYGEQIIDSSWVAYSQISATQSGNLYGAHFWQNDEFSTFKDAPSDLYYCSGFEGQNVFIIPSKDLIIVRMGLDQIQPYDANSLIRDVISAIE